MIDKIAKTAIIRPLGVGWQMWELVKRRLKIFFEIRRVGMFDISQIALILMKLITWLVY